MARKTKECAEKTRKQLIDAARQLFLEHGVSKTTMEQIALRAGYTRGAIHWHFKSKLEIFIAMRDEASAPLIVRLDEILEGTEHNDQMAAIGQSIKEFITTLENDQVTRETFMITQKRCEYTGEFAGIKEQVDKEESDCHTKMSAAFTKAKALGQLRDDICPQIAAEITASFIIGGMNRGLDETGCMAFKYDPRLTIDAFINLLRPTS